MTITTELLAAADGWEHPVTEYQKALPSPAMLRRAAQEIERLTAAVASATDSEQQALIYATRLARSLAARHYPEVTQWRPLDDVLGVLTQIDNMAAGLSRIESDEALMRQALEALEYIYFSASLTSESEFDGAMDEASKAISALRERLKGNA